VTSAKPASDTGGLTGPLRYPSHFDSHVDLPFACAGRRELCDVVMELAVLVGAVHVGNVRPRAEPCRECLSRLSMPLATASNS
jgi:hypothetical protein